MRITNFLNKLSLPLLRSKHGTENLLSETHIPMHKQKVFLGTVIGIPVISLIGILTLSPTNNAPEGKFWQIQSIDTMKYSRDLAREKVNDSNFESEIDSQVSKIANTGATHISIGTPYDEEFMPYLTKWVKTARKYNLKVWFRGNFSGWEGWFDYPKIGRAEHLIQLGSFISKNSNLFEDGDIFTPCTECENGGPGDPRSNGDVEGHRSFLITERETAKQAFSQIGKLVNTGYFSMNGDVAKLIMDKETTERLGGIVVVDHYVKEPERLSEDLKNLAEQSAGKVVLGEFGVPIPDIHGKMSENEQADWINKSLNLISQNPNLIGLNYWVADDGTTAIWDGPKARSAVGVITSYFKPNVVDLKVFDENNNIQEKTNVSYLGRSFETDNEGILKIAAIPSLETLTVSKDGYNERIITIDSNSEIMEVKLSHKKEGMIARFRNFWLRLFRRGW